MCRKIVRILLRVSSNRQLEADGDLSIQRALVKDYVNRQENWILDTKEYFEGSNSGYRNTLEERATLLETIEDAKKGEYDILAVYKDDRIGRRMWEMGSYIMQLRSYGVEVYSVKDGCISPEQDDIMGQIMLALRYGNAQKSSSDTGMRVRDTAQKMVEAGRFVGGKAPYGYELVLSGEISKHGRALHKLQIVSERAAMVREIYNLYLKGKYGSGKIADYLNSADDYRRMAPNDLWKSSTITSILKNPIYTGYITYKRRERRNGAYHRLDCTEWIKAKEMNKEIQIIEEEVWKKAQIIREMRKCIKR